MRIRYISVAVFLAILSFTNQGLRADSNVIRHRTGVELVNMSADDYEFWQVKAIVKYLLSDFYSIDISCIQDNTLLMYDLGLDSFDMLEFTTTCFEYFGINANPEIVLQFANQHTLYSYSEMIFYLL